jgi:predicted MFS family arabinose efflux permease
LSILVFSSTGSGVATAAVYALTYLPAVVGGVLLSGLADRYPRRGLLVSCDLLRAALFACMAIPAVPIWGVAALLTLAVVVGSPHKAAEPAVVADMFDGDQYSAAIGIRTATIEVAQLAGFALGGVLVAAIGARSALAIDAVSFAASGLLLRIYLADRPAVAAQTGRGLASVRAGIATVWGNPRLRALMGFSWLAGCWVVPEGIAAPYAAEHGGGPVAVGVLLAAVPVGVFVGSLVLSRCVSTARRAGVIGPLAVLSGLPLVATGYGPSIPVAVTFWALCGLLSSYQILVVGEFVGIAPAERRGQAIGIAASGLLAVQGLGVLLGGALASWIGTAPAIAVAGVAGAVLAGLVMRAWVSARSVHRQAAPSAQV